MEIGVFIGGSIPRLESILADLEEETEVTWSSGAKPTNLPYLKDGYIPMYLGYGWDTQKCIGFGNCCDNEVSPKEFIRLIKEEQPKEELIWIIGHLYGGTFNDGTETFNGVCLCALRDDGELCALKIGDPLSNDFCVDDLESTEDIKDITEEVSRLWK